MRIIRVSGCYDCPHCKFDGEVKTGDCYYCYWETSVKVDSYMRKATFPDNCPLEEVVQIITKMEIEKKFGSAK